MTTDGGLKAVPNGHPREIERIRRVSRFWAAIWWLGDVAFYSGFLILFFGPTSSAGVSFRKAASLGDFARSLGLVVLACAACVPIGIATGLALKSLSRKRTGVGVK